MKTKTCLVVTSIPLFYFLSVIGLSVAAIEEAPSSSLHIPNNLYSERPNEKRAYAYVSEYKRLPVYNFGLGKRWADNNDDKRSRQFSFGIGKRPRDYRFGIGKRNGYNSLDLDNFSIDNMDGYRARDDNLDELMENKRNYPFNFGIGKRCCKSLGESVAFGRKPNEILGLRYFPDLGKDTAEEDQNVIQ